MTTVILDIKFNIQMKRKSLFSSEYPSLLAAADAMFNKFHQMSDKKNSRAHNNKKNQIANKFAFSSFTFIFENAGKL